MKTIKEKNIKWWIGIGACIVLFSIIAIFSYSKMHSLLNGVEIEAWLEYKDDSSVVKVRGKAQNAIHLVLNGREIYLDKDGSFSESISLFSGFEIITLNAKDKFGKTAEKKIALFNKEV